MLAIFKLGPSLFWSTKKKKKKLALDATEQTIPKFMEKRLSGLWLYIK